MVVTDLSASVMIQTVFSYRVGAEDAPAVLQGPLVLPAILWVYLAPVPRGVAGQVTKGILTNLLQ
jgi:hypothetical protein